MAYQDLIRQALQLPMDWEEVERLVYNVLVQDDLPSLRRIGLRGDQGKDAVQESFYENQSQTDVVVQITSEKTQVYKFQRTVKKLRENGIQFSQLVLVFRDVVGSVTRREIGRQALEKELSVDIRGEDYLEAQLGRSETGVFARFFGTPEEQLRRLLGKSDPLQLADAPLKLAVLASIGCYVLSPGASLARKKLVDRYIIGTVAASTAPLSLDQLTEEVLAHTFAEEETQVRASVQRLERQGSLQHVGGGGFSLNEEIEADMAALLDEISDSYRRLVEYVLNGLAENYRLNAAQKGRVEKNVRKAFVELLQRTGPSGGGPNEALDVMERDHTQLLSTVSKNLKSEIGRGILILLQDYVREPDNQTLIARMTRTYAAVYRANLDPLSREWQASALKRSQYVLDTDAVLRILVEDVPQHAPLLKSLQALTERGVSLIIPRCVLDETVTHVEGAIRTFHRFSQTLLLQNEEFVDANVWHMVVRGYYYHFTKCGGPSNFLEYWKDYYDPDNPEAYVSHILESRIPFTFEDTPEVPETEEDQYHQLCEIALEKKEKKRQKAKFRDSEFMRSRINEDIAWILDVARRKASGTKGYFLTTDSIVWLLEQQEEWGNRPSVAVDTRMLPSNVDFCIGPTLSDPEIVRLFFDPLFILAAEGLAEELETLAKAGVDLKNQKLHRLEWDIKKNLGTQMHALKEADDDQRVSKLTNLVKAAAELGYSVDSETLRDTEEFANLTEEVQELRMYRDAVSAMVRAGSGMTKKGLRRMRGVLREAGIDVDALGIEEFGEPDNRMR